MAICVNCEDSYNDARAALGYKTCLTCGAIAASKETEQKMQQVVVLCPKSSLQYASANDILNIGKKTQQYET